MIVEPSTDYICLTWLISAGCSYLSYFCAFFACAGCTRVHLRKLKELYPMHEASIRVEPKLFTIFTNNISHNVQLHNLDNLLLH